MKHKIPKLGALIALTAGITIYVAEQLSVAPDGMPEGIAGYGESWPLVHKEDYEKTLGMSLPEVASGRVEIPRAFVKDLPKALTTEQDVRKRKQLFAASLLPLILRANERLLKDRAYLLTLYDKWQQRGSIGARDSNWLRRLGRTYRVQVGDTIQPETFQALLENVDIIPPSLALAQGAMESGWGTSRFAQSGNALFGEWVWGDDKKGILPARRNEGATHKIKSFDYLYDSVESYMTNLNRHPAYAELRARRKELRDHNLMVTGAALAPALVKYSERGEAYVNDILSIINFNGFGGLDSARLAAA